MSDAPKKMVVGSMVVAGLIALAAVSDLVIGVPFSGNESGKTHTFLMDIMFIISAAIVGYLAWDAYRELR